MDELHYNVRQFRNALVENDAVAARDIGQGNGYLRLDIYTVKPELARLAHYWNVVLSPQIKDCGCSCCGATIDYFEVYYKDE